MSKQLCFRLFFCAISLALLFDGLPVYGFIYDHSTKDLLEGALATVYIETRRKLIVMRLQRSADDGRITLSDVFQSDRKLAPLMSKYRARCIGSGALWLLMRQRAI